MTEDLTIDGAAETAANAARLLKNEAFNDAYASLIQNIEREVFTTAPGDTEKREQMYYLHRQGKDCTHLLDPLIYSVLGRIA